MCQRHTNLFLRTIWPLFCHDADPFIPEHPDREDGDSSSVDKLHGFNGQHGGDDVVRVVTPRAHIDQALLATTHKHESTRAEKAKQTAAHILVIADRQAVRAVRYDFENVGRQAVQTVVAASR